MVATAIIRHCAHGHGAIGTWRALPSYGPWIYTTHKPSRFALARYLSLSFSDSRPDLSVWSNPGMSERENRPSCADRARVLIVFSCACGLSPFCESLLVSSVAHPLGSCAQGYRRGLRGSGARCAIPELPPVLHIGCRPSDRNLGLRVFASLYLYHQRRSRVSASAVSDADPHYREERVLPK